MGERRTSERLNPMAKLTNPTVSSSTDDFDSGLYTASTTLCDMSKQEGNDKFYNGKKDKMGSEEWSILYNELQALMNPSGDRLKAGVGGNKDVLEAASHEKFCCCPSAQCYSCSNGRAKALHKNASANDDGPQCFWRVPNECPCFGANPQGEVRGFRSNGGATNKQQCDHPNFQLPLPKLFLHLPTSKNCCNYDEIDKHYIPNKRLFKASRCRSRRGRRKISKGLGGHFGILQSTVTVNNNNRSEQNVRFASYLKTVALIFVQDLKSWMPTDLDKLFEEGRHLLMVNDKNKNKTTRRTTFQTESNVSKMFEFRGYKFLIELQDNVWQELKPKQLYRELKTSLEPEYAFVLLQIRHWYILIWQTKHLYFVLDLNGRNRWTFKSDPDAYGEYDAVATLFCLRNVINVVHLIVNMSNLEPNEPYLIRKMIVTKFVTPHRTLIAPHYRSKSDYILVNDNYAYLRSNLHLSLNPEKSKGNHRATAVGIAAMFASKIDHPATWDTKTLDSIICYGVYSSAEYLKICCDFGDTIHNQKYTHCFQIGQFVGNFGIEPIVYQGIWKCRPSPKNTDFDLLLRKTLEREDFLFFEINQQMYSIWKKNDFYYLLDPYRHFIYMPLDENENGLKRSHEKSASVHMFRNVDTLVNLFHDIILLSNQTSTFHIHAFKINWLEHKNQEIVMRKAEEVKEVASLNEFLSFDENYDKCLEELSQISDYDEDIESNILSLISLSTSESYYPGEEEEEGGGEGEIESDYDNDLNKHIKKLENLNKKEKPNLLDKSKIVTKQYMSEEDNSKPNIENDQIEVRKPPATIEKNINRNQTNLLDKSETDKSEMSIYDHHDHSSDQYTDQLALLRKERDNSINRYILEKLRTKTPENISNASSEEIPYTRRKSSGNDSTFSKRNIRKTPSEDIAYDNRKSSGNDSTYCNRNTCNTWSEDTAYNDRKSTGNDSTFSKRNTRNTPSKDIAYDDRKSSGNDSTFSKRNTCNTWSEDTAYNDRKASGNDSTFSKRNTCNTPSEDIAYNDRKSSGYDSTYCKRKRVTFDPNCKSSIISLKNCNKNNVQKLSHKPSDATKKPFKQLLLTRARNCCYKSISKILDYSLNCLDRVLIKTDFENFVVFHDSTNVYYLYEGCTCDLDRFRYWDLNANTVGLLRFYNLHDIICYMIDTRDLRSVGKSFNIKHNRCKHCSAKKWD